MKDIGELFNYLMSDTFVSETRQHPRRTVFGKRHPLHEAVLVELLQSANHQGVCQPSLRELSHATRYSKRSVIRAIQDLFECQVLVVEHRYGADGTQLRNLYRLAATRNAA